MPTLTGLTTNFFATPNEGFTTTTSAPVDSSSATVVPFNSVSGLTNGSIFTGLIDPGNAKERAFTGVVDTGGSQITSVKFTTGTNATHTTGATIVDYVTGTHFGAMTKGILISHDQDGTLKAGAVDNAGVVADGILTAAKSTTATNIETRGAETIFDHVASGLVWSGDAYGSTRVASMTSGVVYIAGVRVPVPAVTSRTFTASRDTYIDVGTDGVVDYNEVTNNNASPALSASHIRIAIIVTGASNIADVGSVNQGQEDKILPIASSIAYTTTDSLGNLICSRDPNRRTLGYRQILTAPTTTSGTVAAITGLTVPVIAPTGRKVLVTLTGNYLQNSLANAATYLSICQGSVSGANERRELTWTAHANNAQGIAFAQAEVTVSGSETFIGCMHCNTGTATLSGSSRPAFIKVELV